MLVLRLQREGGGHDSTVRLRSPDPDGLRTAKNKVFFCNCFAYLFVGEWMMMVYGQDVSNNHLHQKSLVRKSFLLLDSDTHMLNAIWTLATEIQSLNHFYHSFGRTGNTFFFFFQLFFLMGTINSFGEVYNYLKVEAKDKKLLKILKEHLMVIIM